MIVEEIMPLEWPACERRVPEEVRELELARRNEQRTLSWHCKVFGPVAGPLLASGATQTFSAWRVEAWRRKTRPSLFLQLFPRGAT